MNLVHVPFPPHDSRGERLRKLSRYASGPIRITLRSVEVISDQPSAKIEKFQIPLPRSGSRPQKSATHDRSVLILS